MFNAFTPGFELSRDQPDTTTTTSDSLLWKDADFLKSVETGLNAISSCALFHLPFKSVFHTNSFGEVDADRGVFLVLVPTYLEVTVPLDHEQQSISSSPSLPVNSPPRCLHHCPSNRGNTVCR